MLRRLAWMCFFAACVLVRVSPCAAHPATIAAATAKVQANGQFSVQARFDLLAYVLGDSPLRIGDGPMNALLDGPAETLQSQLSDASERFRHEFRVSGDNGPGTIDSIEFPTLSDVQQWRDSGITPRLPVTLTVTVTGHLISGANTISFRFPNVLGMIVVTTEFPYRESTSEPVEAGDFSTPLPLAIAPDPPSVPAIVTAPPVLKSVPVVLGKPMRVAKRPIPPLLHQNASTSPLPPAPLLRTGEGRKSKVLTHGGGFRVLPRRDFNRRSLIPSLVSPRIGGGGAILDLRPAKQGRVSSITPLMKTEPLAPIAFVQQPQPKARPLPWTIAILRYVKMGYLHILPNGLDHILFVLGLFLLSTRTKALLWQITAFTIAHSITLGLALYGIVRLPSSIVEPIIAASIVFVAVENILTADLKPWRPFVVFAFGLVHGMGFAGALKDLGLARQDFLTALVGFNIGVELGQLSVVLAAILAVGWFRSQPNYRRLVVVPASVAIAAVAVFWTFQRILG